jgi:GIY-YIG catalytic domain
VAVGHPPYTDAGKPRWLEPLGGNIRGSTFRFTLAACLARSLGLVRVGPRKLDRVSEERLGKWMRDHLQVAVFPVADRDPLADLEHQVLAELDPPFNLNGMPSSPIRFELSHLRTGLG